MSDPAYWEQSWYEKIVKKIAENMQHTFCILTKNPEIYQKYTFPSNTWLGVTITKNSDIGKLELCMILRSNLKFISFEPLQEKLNNKIFKMIKYYEPSWVIVGPETGNRKDKIICKPEWIKPFFDLDISVFMKGSCKKIIDRPLRQEWPER